MSITIFEAWAAAEAGAPTTADLPALISAAFQASRREALAAAALLRTLAHTRKLEGLLDELNALASPEAPNAALAAATLRVLASEFSSEPMKAAQSFWVESDEEKIAGLSPAEILSQMYMKEERACKAILKHSGDAAFAAELHGVLREALRGKVARHVWHAVGHVRTLAKAGVRLELVPELERLIKNKGTQDLRDSAAEALLAVARTSAPLSLEEALPASKQAASTWAYAHGLASLEHWGRAGRLQDYIADVAATHPLALKLHVIATANAEAFALLPDDLTDDAVMKATSLFPTLIARDLAKLGELSPATRRVAQHLAPHQFIGDEATAWLVSHSEDASPGRFVGGWPCWAKETYTYEIAIRVLARAGEHPQANAARAHLETLLDKEAAVSKMAAQALATLAALRKDEALLERLLGHGKAHVREAALTGLWCGRHSFAQESKSKSERPWPLDDVPVALLTPLLKDKSKGVAALAVNVCAARGAAIDAQALPPLPLKETIKALRSGSYNKVDDAQKQVLRFARDGYSAAQLEPLFGPLADSMEVYARVGNVLSALQAIGADMRKLWPAYAGALSIGRDSDRYVVAYAGTDAANVLDPVVQIRLSSPNSGSIFLYCAEARRRSGHAFNIPERCFDDDDIAAIAVSARGPDAWRAS